VKRKLMSIAAIILMLVVIGVVTAGGSENQRIHQHLAAAVKISCDHTDPLAFCTHLPLISIHTNGQPIPSDEGDNSSLTADFQVMDNPTANNHLYDEAVISSFADIHSRGNSSPLLDKKSLLIKLVTENRTENKLAVMGMPAHDEWVLYGPYLDKTLLRNYLGMNIAAEIMNYTANVRFCEVFLDDHYQGVYLMMESISQGENRINISKYSSGSTYTSYLVRLDRNAAEPGNLNNFTRYAYDTESVFNVVYPESAILTPELRTYIEQDLSKIEKALYSYDYTNEQYGYQNTLDVMSFVDYFILNEFTQNYNAAKLATYLYKDVRGKLTIGPVWDFSSAFDNDRIEFDGTGFSMQLGTWYFMLFKDPAFVDLVIERYHQLRKTVLSDVYLQDYINDTVAYLGLAVDRNFQVWGNAFNGDEDYLQPTERNPANYQEAIQQLKTFITVRGDWLDQNIENLRQYCHESANKKFNH